MKQMSLTEKITYSTVKIQCQYFDGTSGSGTGFIIKLCNNNEKGTHIPVIVTNDHVVENSKKTVFEFCKADAEGNPIDTEVFSVEYSGDSWIHHPDPKVDLRCLPLAEALFELKKNMMGVFYIPIDASLIPSAEQLDELSAMEDVVMIGYPIGLSDMYNHKPIIRKGITSTHPRNDFQGEKETLVDIAAYPGSSGSPVFIVNQGAYTTPGGISVGSRVFLLGVLYGGPQFAVEGNLNFANLPNVPRPVTYIPTNLGILIKSERILEFESYFKRKIGE